MRPWVRTEASEVFLRQVDAAAIEVLGDVAEEVGQLEREPEVARVRLRVRRHRLEDGQHHLADDRRGAVHVHEQIVPGVVLA